MWKVTDINSERETYIEVMEKINNMLVELNNQEIKVCAIVIDSVTAYVASRYFFFFFLLFL